MHFASDNAAPMHPAILNALSRANQGHQLGYGAEPAMERVTAQIRTLFDAPKADVYLVTTGTAANVLALSCLARPWDAVFATDCAHIDEDECNALEFYSGGAKIRTLPARNGKMRPDDLRTAINATGGSVHNPQTGPVSISNVTETGTIYGCDEIAQLAAIAHDAGAALHMDGARFANALVALGCSPADMTWRAGVDVLSFGGTKNGLMGVEAVVFFNPDHGAEFALRRKRAGHLLSKHRYLSAQMEAYLTNNLWLDLARQANAACARLAAGLARVPGVQLLYPAQANIIFARLSRGLHQKLHKAGAVYYLMDGPVEGNPDEDLTCRLVCDWSSDATMVDQFLNVIAEG